MSFQSAIPWRVALRQSLPPLHRPVTILNNPLTNNNSKTKSNNKTKTKNKIKVVYTEDLTHPKHKLTLAGQLTPLQSPAEFAALLRAAAHRNWVVYAKRPFAGPAQVLTYLSRYTH